MLSIDPKQWASSRFKKGQYSKAFCPKLGGGDFLRADEILKNCHVAQIQIMLKPFVSALACVKQHRLIRVEEGVSLKAIGPDDRLLPQNLSLSKILPLQHG